MKKYILLVLSLAFFGYSQTFAIMAPTSTYDTSEQFLASESQICKVATDGCSAYNISEDGKLGDPIMSCMMTSDFKYQWSCSEYKDDIMFMTGTPVVGGDVDQYGCKASAGYSWDMLAGACLRPWEEDISFLSENDQNFYTTFKDRIGGNTLTRIEKALEKYQTKLASFPREKRIGLNTKVVEKVESKISDFLMQFPQDIGLSKKDNHKYMLMTILKFKLMIIGEKMSASAFDQNDKVTYTCEKGNAAYTVYRGDYLIDDMAFAVASDEIHVSDGQFLLPNFIAKREVSASGEKFVGKNTETQKSFTFWFKNEEMSVYDEKDTLINTCTAVFE